MGNIIFQKHIILFTFLENFFEFCRIPNLICFDLDESINQVQEPSNIKKSLPKKATKFLITSFLKMVNITSLLVCIFFPDSLPED